MPDLLLVVIFSGIKLGTIDFLSSPLPESHLKITGGMSPAFIIIWFLIALWTFADPGFHQRSYAAKSGTLQSGELSSQFFSLLYLIFLQPQRDYLQKPVLPNLENPVLSFPLFAEKVLPAGLKGIFYAALFATIISTQVSFLFLSGTTIGRDFIFRIRKDKVESKLKTYTIIGLIIAGLIAILLAYFIPSVIEIWYTIGSLFIPGIILPVVSAYYPKLRVSGKIILFEMVTAFGTSTVWYFFRNEFSDISVLNEVEPMLVGLIFSVAIHFFGLLSKR